MKFSLFFTLFGLLAGWGVGGCDKKAEPPSKATAASNSTNLEINPDQDFAPESLNIPKCSEL